RRNDPLRLSVFRAGRPVARGDRARIDGGAVPDRFLVSRPGNNLPNRIADSRRRLRKSGENAAGREAAGGGYREYPRAMRQSTAAFLATFVRGISGTGH